MDRVFIEGLSVAGKHGVHDDERRGEQEFVLDISATFDTRKAAETDNIGDTIDYVRFRDIAREVIGSETHYLIERIAQKIADRILEDARISEVTIMIRKPTVLPSGVPGVTIVRTRDSRSRAA